MPVGGGIWEMATTQYYVEFCGKCKHSFSGEIRAEGHLEYSAFPEVGKLQFETRERYISRIFLAELVLD